MKLIATIGVTVQVNEDLWTRETVAYEISKNETVEACLAELLQIFAALHAAIIA